MNIQLVSIGNQALQTYEPYSILCWNCFFSYDLLASRWPMKVMAQTTVGGLLHFVWMKVGRHYGSSQHCSKQLVLENDKHTRQVLHTAVRQQFFRHCTSWSVADCSFFLLIDVAITAVGNKCNKYLSRKIIVREWRSQFKTKSLRFSFGPESRCPTADLIKFCWSGGAFAAACFRGIVSDPTHLPLRSVKRPDCCSTALQRWWKEANPPTPAAMPLQTLGVRLLA